MQFIKMLTNNGSLCKGYCYATHSDNPHSDNPYFDWFVDINGHHAGSGISLRSEEYVDVPGIVSNHSSVNLSNTDSADIVYELQRITSALNDSINHTDPTLVNSLLGITSILNEILKDTQAEIDVAVKVAVDEVNTEIDKKYHNTDLSSINIVQEP
jgi:hypothetical protein